MSQNTAQPGDCARSWLGSCAIPGETDSVQGCFEMAKRNRIKLGMLAVVLSVVGVFTVTGQGVASLLDGRTPGQALTDLTNDIYYARRTAADKKVPITVCQSEDAHSCANNGHWEAGWLLFEDLDLSLIHI